MLRFCLQGFTRLYKVYPEMCFTSDLLKQDNIVRFIDDDASKREITTEYITGKSLDQYVGKDNVSALSREHRLHIWQESATGLEWLHGRGILCNDMKPRNIMYDLDRQNTNLLDFGIAAERVDEYFVGSGTP